MRMMISFAPLLLVVCLIASPARAADALEGRWNIKVTPDEEARQARQREFDDVLTFKALQFTSDHLKKIGFASAQYDEDSRRNGPATFTVTLTSDKQGAVKWSGMSTGQDIKGTLVWTQKDGTILNFTFQGTRQS